MSVKTSSMPEIDLIFFDDCHAMSTAELVFAVSTCSEQPQVRRLAREPQTLWTARNLFIIDAVPGDGQRAERRTAVLQIQIRAVGEKSVRGPNSWPEYLHERQGMMWAIIALISIGSGAMWSWSRKDPYAGRTPYAVIVERITLPISRIGILDPNPFSHQVIVNVLVDPPNLGMIRVMGTEYTPSDLSDYLRRELKAHVRMKVDEEFSVRIRADSGTIWRVVRDIVIACKSASGRRVSFTVFPAPETSTRYLRRSAQDVLPGPGFVDKTGRLALESILRFDIGEHMSLISTGSRGKCDNQSIRVALSEIGRKVKLEVEGRSVDSIAAMDKELKRSCNGAQECSILIVTDGLVSFKHVVETIDVCRSSGWRNICLEIGGPAAGEN